MRFQLGLQLPVEWIYGIAHEAQLENMNMSKRRKRPDQRFVRINMTFPHGFDARLERLAQITGSASLSEVVQWAISDFEVKYGLPAIPAIIEQMKKDKEPGKK